jgi:biotin transport system substrate-specific component
MAFSPSSSPARDLAQVAVFAALIIALGMPGAIPVGVGVPITLQTLGVMLAGALLGARKAGLSVVTVWAVGLALPVLAGGRTTLVSLAGPTAGFLIGWLPAAIVVGLLGAGFARKDGRYTAVRGIAAAVIGGIVVQYIFGIGGMMLRADLGLWAAVAANAAYLPGDAAKAVVTGIVAAQVHRAYPALSARARAPRPDGGAARA